MLRRICCTHREVRIHSILRLVLEYVESADDIEISSTVGVDDEDVGLRFDEEHTKLGVNNLFGRSTGLLFKDGP